MSSNIEKIEITEDIFKNNLKFLKRMTNINDWFNSFNEFIIKTHTTPSNEIESIKVIDKPPIEISLKVLSKLDVAKFSATDDNGEKVIDMLIRYQEYLALQLNNYLSIRTDIQNLLDTTWHRNNVLVEFNNYLLLLIDFGKISKSAIENVKKRQNIQTHVDKYGIRPSIEKKFNELVNEYHAINIKLNLLGKRIENLYIESMTHNKKAEFIQYIKDTLHLSKEGLNNFTENVSNGDPDTLEIWDRLWNDYSIQITKDIEEKEENENKLLLERIKPLKKKQLDIKRENIRKNQPKLMS